MNGKVGDKVNMDFNYNSDATFDFDSQNIKLRYEGKEDEIIKLVEAGNVSMPTNSSLVRGATSLFGVRTDMQFGKLKLSTVISQKKSASSSVSSQGGSQLTNYEFSVDAYDENRHFFLGHFFPQSLRRQHEATAYRVVGVTINRVEIWVTNKTGATSDTRNIVGLTDLAEHENISNSMWTPTGEINPENASNTLYSTPNTSLAAARDISQATQGARWSRSGGGCGL